MKIKKSFAGFALICLSVLLLAASPVEKKPAQAPDFKLKDLAGGRAALSDFKDKKPVILLFWTTWCPYCQRALKSLNQTMDGFEKEGITILAVNSGESEAKVARFVKDNGLSFRVFLDPGSAVSDSYHVYGVPGYFLIDKKGYIRAETNTMPLEEARQILKEK